MRKAYGFSLIELLIVVAIILVLAAVAIPNLMRSRIAANESAAVAQLRTINTSQVAYSIANPSLGFADQLTKLKFPPPGGVIDANHAGLLDWVLGCAVQPCSKTGYNFAIGNTVGMPITAYQATAVPMTIGQTGQRGFCIDQIPLMTFDPNGGTNCTQVFK